MNIRSNRMPLTEFVAAPSLQQDELQYETQKHGERLGPVDNNTPVVVLSAKTHGSLGMLRSLGRLGIAVYAIDSDPRGPASYSRYCRRRFVWDFETASDESSLEFLIDTAREIGRRPLLLPTWDETAVFAARYYRELRDRYLLPEQSPELASSLTSKKQMYYLAKRHRIPTPETVFPTSVDEVRQFARTAQFPVMLKGIDGNLLQRRTGKKMVIASSPEQMLESYHRMENPRQPNLMLQEYIPGKDDAQWMFNGYFNRNSDCLIGFTGRKLRQYPVYTGPTSLGICLRNDAVDQTTRRWMKELGYRGVLDIGYRYDARDGQYKVLDVNPRIGATFRLFLGDNGMDVARALYLDLTGQRVPFSVQREGRKWVVEKDIAAFLDYRRDRVLKTSDWLKSLRGIEEFGYFAADDPAPFLRMCMHLVSQTVKDR